MSRWHPLLAGACALALLFGAQAGKAQTLEQVFQAPSKEMRPRLRWWWPGDAVNADELRREIKVLDEAGFGGAEIQSFNPGVPGLSQAERDTINGYATPPFFAHVKAAAEEASARGLTLDYTLGSAWPSGGGFAIPPEKAYVELTMAFTEVSGGKGPVKVAIPSRTKRMGAISGFDPRGKDPRVADWPARLDARAKIVAVIAVKGNGPALQPAPPAQGLVLYPWRHVDMPGQLDEGSALVLTDKLRDDGTLDWTPPAGTWQVFVFKQYAVNMGILAGTGEGPQLTLDHMDPSAFAAHVARVADPLPSALGPAFSAVRSTFVDSLELMQDLPWTENFLAEFKKRRGYDLTPYLPLVLQPGWMQAWGEYWSPPYFEAGDSTAERVRADYRRTVSDLMFVGFVDPFVAWNHAHGLQAKFQAHGGALDIVRGYGAADIPETEDLAGADPYFMRFARSGADLYGRAIVSAESLCWKDRPYSVTPDELRQRADLIFASGVNSLVIHGTNYRRDGVAWPGWHAFQPSAFSLGFSTMVNETNPIWAGVPTLAAYFARTQAVLRQGKPVVPVAYFYGQVGYYAGIEDRGADAELAQRHFLAGGYDFDRVNPDALAHARVEDHQLVSAGGARYPVLVLPPVDGIAAETAEQIAAFAQAGLPVVFADHAPTRDEGLANHEARDARVRVAVAATLQAGARVVPADGVVDALRLIQVPANLRFTGDPTDVVYVQRRVGDQLVTFLHNAGGQSRDASLVLPGRGAVTRWNALDGTITAASGVQSPGDGTAVPLTLPAGASALLVQDTRLPPLPAPAPVLVTHKVLPQDGWTLLVNGHGPKGGSVSRPLTVTTLGDWSQTTGLGDFAGEGAYQRTVEVERSWLGRGRHVLLALGEVHDMAVVTINGHRFQPLVTRPFKVDVTAALRPGRNTLEITVLNTPQNAMVDAKAPGFKLLKPVPAGLVGPVEVEVMQ
ncbi:glycosyl hydrolase [Nitrospirillum iridis]|uniref:Alpha-L-rhamnosidase n=1 Tax=Nitrospirillum iridis TaxID=765888 RepID=A0A7X0B4P6_9PROT|nr:glycosyl hydrolase [Nitrospirillum iridis]MBB6255362.1 hypothetical protein [Nitrospirillum iridis]